MAGLTGLRELALNGNRLASLPRGLGRLKNLRKLDLRDNPLPTADLVWVRMALPYTDINY